MKALVDCARSEVTLRAPFTDPGALESAMQSHCGDGATPEEIAEMQSKLEWFTHFSACQMDQHLVLLGASRIQIRSVMTTLRVDAAPEGAEKSDGPEVTASQDDCLPTEPRSELSTREEPSKADVTVMPNLAAITRAATASALLEEEGLRVPQVGAKLAHAGEI